jgi:4-hydroxyphenylacetate 3-monooxygenase
MGVCIGKAFVASLRDKRRIHIDGERVTDVTRDPRFAGAAQSLAALYNMQHDPALAPLVWAEPGQGDRIGPQICGHTIYLWKPGHN